MCLLAPALILPSVHPHDSMVPLIFPLVLTTLCAPLLLPCCRRAGPGGVPALPDARPAAPPTRAAGPHLLLPRASTAAAGRPAAPARHPRSRERHLVATPRPDGEPGLSPPRGLITRQEHGGRAIVVGQCVATAHALAGGAVRLCGGRRDWRAGEARGAAGL